MPKRPFMKFYPADWRSDPALRMCSAAARGVWIDMLCIMHEAEPCGFLSVNGKPLTPKQLATVINMPLAEVEAALEELDDAGVFSRNKAGVIYSRRMNRDRKLRESGEKNARKRWEQTVENKAEKQQPNGVPNSYILEARDYKERKKEPNGSFMSEPASLPLGETTPAAPELTPAMMVEIWNAERKQPCPRVDKLTAKRRTHCKARIADTFETPDDFRNAVRRMMGSSFMRGRTGWVGGFDWLVANEDNPTKLAEGKYDDNAQAKAPSDSPSPTYRGGIVLD
jgi:hypothetical protein